MKKEIKFLEKYYLEFEKLITNEHFKNTINLKNQILKIKNNKKNKINVITAYIINRVMPV